MKDTIGFEVRKVQGNTSRTINTYWNREDANRLQNLLAEIDFANTDLMPSRYVVVQVEVM